MWMEVLLPCSQFYSPGFHPPPQRPRAGQSLFTTKDPVIIFTYQILLVQFPCGRYVHSCCHKRTGMPLPVGLWGSFSRYICKSGTVESPGTRPGPEGGSEAPRAHMDLHASGGLPWRWGPHFRHRSLSSANVHAYLISLHLSHALPSLHGSTSYHLTRWVVSVDCGNVAPHSFTLHFSDHQWGYLSSFVYLSHSDFSWEQPIHIFCPVFKN